MSKELELIMHEVNRQFKSERAFYQEVGISQTAWEKIKSGDTSFDNIKVKNYQMMLSLLFTEFEKFIFNQAIIQTNFNWHENAINAMHDIKFKYALDMLDRGASIELMIGETSFDGTVKRKPYTAIKIVWELDRQNYHSITFQLNCLPHTIPSGKLNRRKWFDENFENEVVK